MLPNPLRISRDADLLFTLHHWVPDADIERFREEIKANFSGHRAIIVRADDVTITPIERRYTRAYRPSMLAHGGRA